jgi:hypothetical protein
MLVLLPTMLYAQQGTTSWTIGLAWDPNTESDLAGYRLYHKVGSSFGGVVPYNNFIAEIPVGTQTFNIQITEPGTHYFIVTAYNESGKESGPSNEIYKVINGTPPANPTNLTITINININLGN